MTILAMGIRVLLARHRGQAFLFVLLCGVLLMGCGGASGARPEACDADDGGLTLPDKFCATVVADDLGPVRHLTVSDSGDVYAALYEMTNEGGIVALRDTDGDYKADRRRYFGDAAGSGIGLWQADLYFSADTTLWHYEKAPASFLPLGTKEVVVDGFPEQDQHAAKTMAFNEDGDLFVNIGAPSNACMKKSRTKGSPGQDPCPLLDTTAGIWKYRADGTDQQHDPSARYASGIRNAVALTWRDALEGEGLYAVQHGRDQLHQFFPDLYTKEESAELPAEELFKVEAGDNFGWPYCYYDWQKEKKVLMPEYGGDGTKGERCDQFKNPIQAFPGHWGPNDILFYDGGQFPERYKEGAFIAWHGSWNRAPMQQEGYKITFTPFDSGSPSADYEVFADGFAATDTLKNPSNAKHRPTGLAMGPEGGLYVSDDEGGTIWRISYFGNED